MAPDDIVVERVVRGEGDEAAARHRERKEDLHGCSLPHLRGRMRRFRGKREESHIPHRLTFMSDSLDQSGSM